jgi:hydroxyethylthiazole kinase
VAAEKVQARGLGVGRLAVSLLDALQLLDRVTFENRLRLEVSTWPG